MKREYKPHNCDIQLVSLMYTSLTHSWMYCSKKGEALKLSTGQSKKPWISFWCKSIVMTWVSPDLHNIFASNLLTMQPRFLILPAYDNKKLCHK